VRKQTHNVITRWYSGNFLELLLGRVRSNFSRTTAILHKVLCGFSSVHPGKFRVNNPIWPLLIPIQHFQINYSSVFILWHDAWKPEVCGQKITAETSVARQRIDETRSRVLRCQREYTSVSGQRNLLPRYYGRVRDNADVDSRMEPLEAVMYIRSAWS
jgi:hypothetical protein